MKNKKNIIILVAVLALAFVLGATGLVKLEKKTDDVEKGRLVGVFMSFDFFDENLDRVYAKVVTGADGEWNYSFEGIEGCFVALVEVGQGDAAFRTIKCSDTDYLDGAISSEMTNFDKQSISVTLHRVVKSGPVRIFYNPIYQLSSGEVYVAKGTGFQNNAFVATGFAGSVSDTQKTALTANGEKKEYEGSYTVTMMGIDETVKVVVSQFDSSNQQIDSKEYKMDEIPESIVVAANTEYVIVEKINKDKEGKIYSDRELVSKDTENWSYFTINGIGMGVRHEVKMMWK